MNRPLDDRDRRLLDWIAATLAAEHLAGSDDEPSEDRSTDPVAECDATAARALGAGTNKRS